MSDGVRSKLRLIQRNPIYSLIQKEATYVGWIYESWVVRVDNAATSKETQLFHVGNPPLYKSTNQKQAPGLSYLFKTQTCLGKAVESPPSTFSQTNRPNSISSYKILVFSLFRLSIFRTEFSFPSL